MSGSLLDVSYKAWGSLFSHPCLFGRLNVRARPNQSNGYGRVNHRYIFLDRNRARIDRNARGIQSEIASVRDAASDIQHVRPCHAVPIVEFNRPTGPKSRLRRPL